MERAGAISNSHYRNRLIADTGQGKPNLIEVIMESDGTDSLTAVGLNVFRLPGWSSRGLRKQWLETMNMMDRCSSPWCS